MATHNRKRRMPRCRPQRTEENDRPKNLAGETVTEHPIVVNIEHWRRRPPYDIPVPTAKIKPTVEDATPAGRVHKQAVLLKLILSDTIAEAALDAMIETVASLARGRGGSE
jgi:hypothetical protein